MLDSCEFGGSPAPAGIKILLIILYKVGINSVLDGYLVHVAFKSFDLNLLMAHTAIFLKRVWHQTVYDNWHTATCIKYHSDDSTHNLVQMAQKVSFMLFKAELTPL